MPKNEIKVKTGEKLPLDHESFLRARFDDKTIKQLETKGGSIKISIVFKRAQKKKSTPKDLSFLAKTLLQDSQSQEEIEHALASLSSSDLKDFGHAIDLKLPNKKKKSYMISHILNFLLSKRHWDQIIDSNK